MKTPPLSPILEKLPLVQISRALDRIVDCWIKHEPPTADDVAIAAQWIERQRMSNLARGLFEGCEECGAQVTKYGCPNCMRTAIERVLNDSESKPGGWGPDIAMQEVLRNALKASSPNDKLTHGALAPLRAASGSASSGDK